MINYLSCLPVMKKYNETNDCTVKAVSIVTNQPYMKAHALLKAHGRKNRNGTWNSQKVVREMGFNVVRIQCEAKTIATLSKHLDPKRRYMVSVSGHILAYVKGVIEDWTEGGDKAKAAYLAHHGVPMPVTKAISRRHITTVYEVTPKQSKNAIRKAKRYA